jgi:hypothetical protein
MQMWIRRWWVKTWAPFSLVVLGAAVLWVLNCDVNDSGFIALMAVLIACGWQLTDELAGASPAAF